MHPWQNFGSYEIESPEQDVRLHFAAADRAGITYLYMFSLGNPIPQTSTLEEFRKANDWTLAMWEFERERLLPFCYVSPEFPDESMMELDHQRIAQCLHLTSSSLPMVFRKRSQSR